ncbi:recombinase [Pantoea phage vB_PagS_AAS23]|uniref:Recombinase n=1 Tax=Pantoea phage vB_PagS_AAS23 TaxID=2499073 RepID=A0A3S9U7Z7_9CAUD|nr:Erf-like ssDNA annealing protein [Pantoea phage vB_PagS_AAS23]AZS06339.1 recombinase [Pantoea phage vB_PagS_AAS23]
MYRESKQTDLVYPAIFAARKMFVKVLKDRVNSHLKNSYATLDSVLDTISEPLFDNGLYIEQSMDESTTRDTLRVITTVRHESGQFVSFLNVMPVAKQDAQGAGSAFTYSRRYSLAACFGLSQADDDAERSVLTARDWNKKLDKCEDKDSLQSCFKDAWKNLDAANRAVVQSHYEERKAKFEAESAPNGGGFKLPQLKDVAKVKDEVATQRTQSVQSEQSEATPIENFE